VRIVVIGGGPAGLYFGILHKKAFPQARVEVLERNRPEDTFGFGVVFSDETLGFLEDADPESYAAIRARFRSWREIRTWFRGEWTTSSGHGFSALARATLLDILQRRAIELGCSLRFRAEVDDLDRLLDADLVVACDGVNSQVRTRYADRFGARVEEGACRFSWLGTTLPLEAFTFIFAETDPGLLMVHAYPYDGGRSTWIVECHEETWRRAGFDDAGEAETVATCERLLAPWLSGHPLLANRSVWRQFPTVTCDRWHFGNVVLLGDAAHTAHFSIGSGTKLAMEDAIALAGVLRDLGMRDVPRTLAAYQETRRLDVLKLQRAAATSRAWFEQARRWSAQTPVRFAFNLMTRSKRITYDELKRRDPRLAVRVDADFAAASGHQSRPGIAPPPPAFVPFRARSVELANRLVVSPMCQYSAVDGEVGDWHLVHLGSRASGGAGLVIAEMTDVSAEGRITRACAGLYRREHVAAWRRIVEFVHGRTAARIGCQIAHAGRKGSVAHDWSMTDRPLAEHEGSWTTLAPSAIPFRPGWPVPRAMERADMERVRDEFARSALWAAEAGFDWLELHLGHGYLLSSFLSPLANRRADDFGGSLENRMRFPLEVTAAVRASWPTQLPMSARISASDWFADGRGFTLDDAVALSRELKALGVDVVGVSSAGNVPDSPVEYGRMYQAPFADRIRHEAGVAVMAVGGILDADHANTLLAAGRADLAALARAHLADPYLGLHEAARYGVDAPWPGQYQMGRGLARSK
jgi:anthraniloyl-CoA monooxygenase